MLEGLDGTREAAQVGGAPPDRNCVQSSDHRSQNGRREQLFLREEVRLPRDDRTEQGRIPEGDVIGGDDKAAALREKIETRNAPSREDSQDLVRQEPGGTI